MKEVTHCPDCGKKLHRPTIVKDHQTVSCGGCFQKQMRNLPIRKIGFDDGEYSKSNKEAWK